MKRKSFWIIISRDASICKGGTISITRWQSRYIRDEKEGDGLIEFIVRGDRFLEAIRWMSTRMTSFLTVRRKNNGERRKLRDRPDAQLHVSLKCEPRWNARYTESYCKFERNFYATVGMHGVHAPTFNYPLTDKSTEQIVQIDDTCANYSVDRPNPFPNSWNIPTSV